MFFRKEEKPRPPKNKEISWRTVSKQTVFANAPPKYSFPVPPRQTCRTKEIWLGPPGNDSASALFHRAIILQILNHHFTKEHCSLSKKVKPWWVIPTTKSAVSTCVVIHSSKLLAVKPNYSHFNIYINYSADENTQKDVYAEIFHASVKYCIWGVCILTYRCLSFPQSIWFHIYCESC